MDAFDLTNKITKIMFILCVCVLARSLGKQLCQFHQLQIFCTIPWLRVAVLHLCVDDRAALFYTVLGGELRSALCVDAELHEKF